MSAAGRKHRKAAGRYRMAEALREADKAVAGVIGVEGDEDLVMKGSVLYIVPRVLPGMADELAEAIARRRRATLDGRCECGGRRHTGNSRPGHLMGGTFLHEEDCPAHDRAIAALVLRTGWRWSA